MHQQPQPKGETFIHLKEVCKRTGLGRTAIYARIGRRQFPRQVKLGKTVSVWVEREVDDWIDRQIAAARQKEAA